MGVFGDYLGFEASSMRDRLAITLNVMESGLSYASPIGEISLAEATWLVTTLALADGDANVLVATGSRKMWDVDAIPDKTLGAISWAKVPARDLELRLGYGQRRPLNIQVTSEGLAIDVVRIADSECFPPEEPALSFVAKNIQKWYHVERHRRIEANQPVSPPFHGTDPNQLFHDNVAQVLSLAMAAGGPWSISCAARMKRGHYNVDFAEQSNAIFDIFELIEKGSYHEETGEQVFTSPQGNLETMFPQIESLMEFASSAVRTVAGNVDEHNTGLVDADSKIRLCMFSDGTNKWMDLVFVPKTYRDKLFLVYPTAVMECEDFPIDTKRSWVLESRADAGETSQAMTSKAPQDWAHGAKCAAKLIEILRFY